jgi:hypothetical protein
MKKQRLKWWTLQWPNGTLAIDADNNFHLHKTFRQAADERWDYEEIDLHSEEAVKRLPVPVEISIKIHKAKKS